MNWQPLKPSARSHAGVEIRFAIRHQSNSSGVRLVLSIRPDVAKKAGFSEGDKLQLQHGRNERTGAALGRLVDVSGPGSMPYHAENNGRGNVEFSCSGDVREAWTDNASPMTDLGFVSVAKGEIVFEMPTWVEEGGGY
jgi:hypothetical protein